MKHVLSNLIYTVQTYMNLYDNVGDDMIHWMIINRLKHYKYVQLHLDVEQSRISFSNIHIDVTKSSIRTNIECYQEVPHYTVFELATLTGDMMTALYLYEMERHLDDNYLYNDTLESFHYNRRADLQLVNAGFAFLAADTSQEESELLEDLQEYILPEYVYQSND